MEFDGFDWDGGNRTKCQKHGVSTGEIESVFWAIPVIAPDVANFSAEHRFRAVGCNADRRKIFVVFTLRQRGGATLIRPLSARFMHKKEVEAYEKSIPRLQD